jgi:hypothetical protein
MIKVNEITVHSYDTPADASFPAFIAWLESKARETGAQDLSLVFVEWSSGYFDEAGEISFAWKREETQEEENARMERAKLLNEKRKENAKLQQEFQEFLLQRAAKATAKESK